MEDKFMALEEEMVRRGSRDETRAGVLPLDSRAGFTAGRPRRVDISG